VEEQSAIDLNVYPNPASDFITLQGDVKSNATVEVYNAQGQKMFNGIIPPSRQLDVSSWNAGMYFIAITQDGQRINKCVIIE
jgi:hypothetical protein